MKHWTIYLVLGLFVAVLMSGCSKKDKDFEVVVERDNESIQIKGEDAEITIGENASIPDEFHSDIPIYPGLEIYTSMTEKEEKLFSVQGKTSDNSEDVIAFYKKKLSNDLRLVFPGYSNIFSNITSKTSIQILKTYPMPKDILSSNKDDLIKILLTTSKKGVAYAEDKYSKLISTAESAKIIGIPSSSLFIKLISDINIIENFEIQIKLILEEIQNLIFSDKISD